jgi:hypothetical protein
MRATSSASQNNHSHTIGNQFRRKQHLSLVLSSALHIPASSFPYEALPLLSPQLTTASKAQQ